MIRAAVSLLEVVLLVLATAGIALLLAAPRSADPSPAPSQPVIVGAPRTGAPPALPGDPSHPPADVNVTSSEGDPSPTTSTPGDYSVVMHTDKSYGDVPGVEIRVVRL